MLARLVKVAHLVPQLDALSSEPMVVGLLSYRARSFGEQWVACPGLDPQRGAGLRAARADLSTVIDPPAVYERLAQADLIHVHCPSAAWGVKFLEPLRRTSRPLLFTLYGAPLHPVALPAPCVCTDSSVYESQSRVSPGCELIEMGVDLARLTPSAERPRRDRLVVTRIGSPLRHSENLWLALADVLCRRPEVELRIIGGYGTGSRRVRVLAPETDVTVALGESDLLVAAPQPGEGSVTYGVMAAMAMSATE